jgi:hypothetical protein
LAPKNDGLTIDAARIAHDTVLDPNGHRRTKLTNRLTGPNGAQLHDDQRRNKKG